MAKAKIGASSVCPIFRTLIALLVFLVCNNFDLHESRGDEITSGFKLSLSVDKNHVRQDDEIKITGKIKNVSSSEILLYGRSPVYPTAQIKMFDQKEKPLITYIKLIPEIEPPRANDIVKLGPGDELTKFFTVKIKRQRIQDVEKGGHKFVEGLFLDFNNSAILIPQRGRYNLLFGIECSKEFAEEMERILGFAEIWYGKASSNPVEIVVE